MLQGKVISHLRRQSGQGRWCSGGGRSSLRDRVRGRLTACIVTFLVVPRRPVVRLRGRIESGIESVFGQLEAFLYDKRRVSVVGKIFFRNAVVLERVVQHSAQKRNIRSGANLEEQI